MSDGFQPKVIFTPHLIPMTRGILDTCYANFRPGALSSGGHAASEVYEMYKAGAIAISDDGIPLKNSKLMRYALEYSKMINIPVM